MNLNNLKPAWQQLRVLNSMQSMDKEEILSIIEQAEALSSKNRFLVNSIMLAVLIICCKGG